jgi:hypothetical protein
MSRRAARRGFYLGMETRPHYEVGRTFGYRRQFLGFTIERTNILAYGMVPGGWYFELTVAYSTTLVLGVGGFVYTWARSLRHAKQGNGGAQIPRAK